MQVASVNSSSAESTPAAAESYRQLNNSFRQKLVFRLGASAGFFSEYNNMLLAMLYCLDHRIRFVLYSSAANFAYRRGWEDFFVPFTAESRISLHSRYNKRTENEFRAAESRNTRRNSLILKRLTGTEYLTHDLFDAIREEAKSGRHYEIPELGINGDVRHACQVLLGLTWRFNPETSNSVSGIISGVGLPSEYVGIHIRSGEKFTEATPFGVESYVRKVEENSALQHVYVATDDYTNVETLRSVRPQWTLYHACDTADRGYDQARYEALSRETKRKDLVDLLVDVEILSRSSFFVGTFTSNVGMFVGLRVSGAKSAGLDSPRWFVW